MERSIRINGAREHNLKDITVEIPHGKHTVIVGVSGSGKSTLAYNVIYAAGHKRLLDCLSEETKRLTSHLKQPDVNFIEGLTPVISMKQEKPRSNPRATLGTLSEISTYLRYLYSLVGEASCPFCNRTYPVRPFHYLARELEKLPESTTVEVQFPIYKSAQKKYDELFSELRRRGYERIEVDGERKDLRDWISMEKEPGLITVVSDRFQIRKELSKSDIQILQNSLRHGEGFLRIVIPDPRDREECAWFFEKHGCPEHGMLTSGILPSFFSFNDLNSCCEDCHGTGIRKVAYPSTLVQNKRKSLRQGPFYSQVLDTRQPFHYMRMYSLARHYGFSFDEPFENLPSWAKDIIFYGTSGETFPLLRPEGYEKEMPGYTPRVGEKVDFEGLVTRINRLYRNKERTELSEAEEAFFDRFMIDEVCGSCRGTRLKPHRNHVHVSGYSFYDLGNLELEDLRAFIEGLEIPYDKTDALVPVLHEIRARLDSLIKIGLGYLSLNRRADSLSGGEYQRARLAGQIGSGLMGLTYIIDEPSVGLHGTDNARIIALLEELRDQGNTVITIEHDLDIIGEADYVVELGPGAGTGGGELIACGTVDEVKQNERSVIAPYLGCRDNRLRRTQAATEKPDCIRILGAQANNLKDIDVVIPLGRLVCVTGVSLIIEVLYKALWSSLHDPRAIPGKHRGVQGVEKIKDVYCIDQSPISRSKTSIPATYIGVFDALRKVFAGSDSARRHGIADLSFFSFNSKGGCPSCKGLGYIDTHIHYLGDLTTMCPVCNGARYTPEVLEVLYKGKNIAEVLGLTVDTALSLFEENPYIHNKLKHVHDLGLGYMTLGQQISTVSGGEAQRLRLAKEISKIRGKKNMLYIMDEPTTGLHSKDISRLLTAIRTIVDRGNTVIVIEHNPDVITSSDHIIDLGPEAGKRGGEVVAQGTLQEILECPQSKTGQYLRSYLGIGLS